VSVQFSQTSTELGASMQPEAVLAANKSEYQSLSDLVSCALNAVQWLRTPRDRSGLCIE
jgi:hypothetical protein